MAAIGAPPYDRALPYHVQIRRSFYVARAFNLDGDELRRTVVGPWAHGLPVSLGEREWEPTASRLTILEGPALPPAELGVGQGWPNAERASHDVTAQLLAGVGAGAGAAGAGTAGAGTAGPGAAGPGAAGAGAAGAVPLAAVAVLAESPAAAQAAGALVARLGMTVMPWAPLRAAIVARTAGTVAPGPLPAAVLVVFGAEPAAGGADVDWWLDVGMALGAFGPRAVVAAPPGRGLPAPARDAGAMALAAGDEELDAAARMLAERLRAAGLAPPAAPR